MASKIQHKRSSVPGKVPTDVQLQSGELAINTADKALYTKDSTGNVIALNDWANIANKPLSFGDVGSSTFSGPTAPNPEEYSFWWDTANNALKVSVDDGVIPAFWSDTISKQPGNTVFVAENYQRELLQAARTYYVSTTGNDNNDGRTVGTPFATIQKAVDVVSQRLHLNDYLVTIQLADGTYNESVTLKQLIGVDRNKNIVTIQGNTSSMSAVTVAGNGVSGSYCFDLHGAEGYRIRYLRIVNSTGGGIVSTRRSAVMLSNINFGATLAIQMHAQFGSTVEIDGQCIISGGGTRHVSTSRSSRIMYMPSSSTTITISGTPNFSQAFAYAEKASHIWFYQTNFSGSATGKRYEVNTLSSLVTYQTTTWLPGNVAGTTATGGIYT